jgi:hypothetical protein
MCNDNDKDEDNNDNRATGDEGFFRDGGQQ